MQKQSLSQKIGNLNAELEVIRSRVKTEKDQRAKTKLLIKADALRRKINTLYESLKKSLHLSPS